LPLIRRSSFDVDAAFMHMEWNDMNAASTPYVLVRTVRV